MTSRMRRRLRRAALACALLVLALAAAGAWTWRWLGAQYRAPGPGAATVRIKVAPGTSVRTVLARLAGEGAVRDARAVQWYLRLHARHPRMLAGVYDIPPHASPAEIIEMFVEGRVVLEQLTVVEGSTFADFLALLAHEPDVLHTLAGKTPAEIMAALGHPGENPEGRFFPDTYRFAADTTDAAILGLAYDQMRRALEAAWDERSPGLPFDTPYQALILASMVEKEAAHKAERARIAGVFVSRLHKGMRLQSDPTVIYGLGAGYDGSIHTRDLLRDTPYNTYTRTGLPPTPIALPGREALLAAVHPDVTGDLYFVATGLGDGAHQFSKTFEAHNSAVKLYLARLRKSHAAAAADSGGRARRGPARRGTGSR
jgi:UPF0755 protein